MVKKTVQWKWIILASIVFFIFISFVLPQMYRYSIKVMGTGKSPDTSLIYSASDLYDIAESYGEVGRKEYIKLRWTFDLIWPLVYTSFLVLWTIKLTDYIPDKRKIRYLFILPIISMFFDFMENIGATIVMARYPLKSGLIANITPWMTLIKWLTVLGSALVIVALIIRIVVDKRKK